MSFRSTRASARRHVERTQADLLAAVTEEFARDGFFGAQVGNLSTRSRPQEKR